MCIRDRLTFEVSEAHVQELKDSIPELPVAKALRYVKEYGLDVYKRQS